MEERFDAEYLIALVVALSLISLIALIAVALTVMRCRHRLHAAGEKQRRGRGRHGGQRRQSNSSVNNSSGSSGGGGFVSDEEKRSIIRCTLNISRQRVTFTELKKNCTLSIIINLIKVFRALATSPFQVSKRRRERELQRRRR